MKLGEIAVHMDNNNFHQNQMKNKKVLLLARFSVCSIFFFSKSYLSYELLGDISSWSNSKLLLILGKDILRRFSGIANAPVIDIKTNKIQKRILVADDVQGKAILAQMVA